MSVGLRLKQVRDEAGLSQADFASRLGTGAGRISQIEANKNVPGGDLLIRLHREFGTDITWLLTGERVGAVAPAPTLPPRQRALLDNYDAADEAGKRVIEGAADLAAQSKTVRRRKAG